jgi:transcription initiation factor TFIIIB Brf1 subunit/transcription initiation factor TFIIB
MVDNKSRRIKIVCPSCGKAAFKTVGRLESDNEFACGCGRTISADDLKHVANEVRRFKPKKK